MIFRVGGLFILCVFGAIALSKASPFAGIGYEAGLLLTTVVYASLVTLSLWGRRNSPTPSKTSLPPLPKQPWGMPILGSAALALLISEFVQDSVLLSVLRIGGAILSGLGFLMFCKVALQQGYFPGGKIPQGKYRGISREEDKPQFFATVLMFLIMASGCFYWAYLLIFQQP